MYDDGAWAWHQRAADRAQRRPVKPPRPRHSTTTRLAVQDTSTGFLRRAFLDAGQR